MAQAAIRSIQMRIGRDAPIDGLMLAYQPPPPPFLTKPLA
jgi:hypothetical protein